jgi:hypothetical protein
MNGNLATTAYIRSVMPSQLFKPSTRYFLTLRAITVRQLGCRQAIAHNRQVL